MVKQLVRGPAKIWDIQLQKLLGHKDARSIIEGLVCRNFFKFVYTYNVDMYICGDDRLSGMFPIVMNYIDIFSWNYRHARPRQCQKLRSLKVLINLVSHVIFQCGRLPGEPSHDMTAKPKYNQQQNDITHSWWCYKDKNLYWHTIDDCPDSFDLK